MRNFKPTTAACSGLLTLVATAAIATPAENPPPPIDTIVQGQKLPEDNYNTTLRFTQKFGTPGETLDLSLHRSISHQHEHYDYVNDSFVPPAATFYNNLSFTEDEGVTEADVDYTLPLSKTQTLKLGYAFEQDDYGFDNVGAVRSTLKKNGKAVGHSVRSISGHGTVLTLNTKYTDSSGKAHAETAVYDKR